MTSVKTRQCFLIDSLLEKPNSLEEQSKDEAIDLIKRSPSSSIPPECSSPTAESEDDEDKEPSRLSQLISNMIERNNGESTDMQSSNSQQQHARPILPMGNPMEYLSKLHLMQQAFNLSAMSMRNQFTAPIMPILRKDMLFPRPISQLRPPRQHGDSSRSNAKKYRCDVCDKTFSRSNTLITHKRIHTGEKPFKCDHCGRAFRQPGNLTRHRLTHTTVKPYVCAQCDKAFNRASNLHTHMRTHGHGK